MSTYGRQVLTKTGRDVMVLADLQDAQFKLGGITRDWNTYTAAPSDVTLTDQTPIKTGERYSRFGQIECEITATGKYGPYDLAASDGRQNLVRGKCFINNRTMKENGHIAELQSGPATDHSQVFDGGTGWKARLLVSGGAASLAAGPTVAAFEAAFPRIAYAQ
jgi:hypothetical protein